LRINKYYKLNIYIFVYHIYLNHFILIVKLYKKFKKLKISLFYYIIKNNYYYNYSFNIIYYKRILVRFIIYLSIQVKNIQLKPVQNKKKKI